MQPATTTAGPATTMTVSTSTETELQKIMSILAMFAQIGLPIALTLIHSPATAARVSTLTTEGIAAVETVAQAG